MSTLIATNPVPLPSSDKVVNGRDWIKHPKPQEVDPNEYIMTPLWVDALNQQALSVAAAPTTVNRVSEPDLSAAVVTTDLAGSALAEALYEVRGHARIKTAAGVSSSVTITIGWTEGGVIQSESFAALTGNTTTTVLTGPSKTFRADAGTPITYAVAYASNPAAAAHYSLDVTLSRVAP